MASPEQAPVQKAPTSRWRWVLRILTPVVTGLVIAWACGAAMRLDSRLETPPGLFRGALHGAMMPVAWPALLAGHDQDIYSNRNDGRLYKLGYSLGVNLSGLLFFGWLFMSVDAVRTALTRRKQE